MAMVCASKRNGGGKDAMALTDERGNQDDEPRNQPPRRRAIDRWSRWDTRVRDSVLYAVGIAGIVNELFLRPEPRPASLVFLASIVGVPIVLRGDEKRR